ncbi:hypothetical protein ACIRPU_11490 [Streptomyces sp. NPDC102259]|uniref:hypothetical protein n=1 Tax=Streptomyces sp. NPDC102259 TaxID=3366148 RepID=UPI003801EAC2
MRSGEQSGRDVLARSLKGQARRVGLGAALGCVHQLGEALVPVLIGVVIDQAVAGRDAGRLALWLAVLTSTLLSTVAVRAEEIHRSVLAGSSAA